MERSCHAQNKAKTCGHKNSRVDIKGRNLNINRNWGKLQKY